MEIKLKRYMSKLDVFLWVSVTCANANTRKKNSQCMNTVLQNMNGN